MKIIEIMKRKTALSFEVFPPKCETPVEAIHKTLDGLNGIDVDFISVTYGAGGSETDNNTFEIAGLIKREYGIESVAHLPCIRFNKEDVIKKLDGLKKLGIENILALRGDIPEDFEGFGDFQHACDLISYIKEHGDFNIIAACYPEGHAECKNRIEDIHNLKTKVDAGASQLITQLFFDNDYFYSFMERCQIAGIDVPVQAGIMPVINKNQVKRMASLCGASIPEKFAAMMERYGDDPEAMRDAGIAYAADQIADLIAHGVDGIHLYIMNNPHVAQKIYEAVRSMISLEKK
ncbi:MAG: methylenetetrahydrofolate reductase [NAD(P)H] [Firmicutes bacterium]|nr:methylenetetrahydrofolate reductase [NAD(P)H] [Bacillota bacterium]